MLLLGGINNINLTNSVNTENKKEFMMSEFSNALKIKWNTAQAKSVSSKFSTPGSWINGQGEFKSFPVKKEIYADNNA